MAVLSFGQGLRRSDIGLFTVTVALVLLGLAALFSFSLNTDASHLTTLWQQAAYAGVGLVLALVLLRFDYRLWGGFHWVLYAVANALLIGVLLFGQTIRGHTGWFVVGPLHLQPVEFAKILLAVSLAKALSDWMGLVGTWRFILRSALFMALPVALVVAQPDLGSAAVLVGMWVILMVFVPVPRRRLAVLALLAVVVAVVAWTTILRPYQKDRVLTFIDPSRDALGAGYNIRQALAAIGSGQLFGRGLGLGPQSQLNFLPERQTDFIFASICEELGFVGGGVIIVLYGVMMYRLIRILERSEDPFTSLCVVSLGSIVFIHVIVNVGMNLGLLPVTGIPLPFISAGGSALISGFIIIGLLESIATRIPSRKRSATS